MAITRVSVGTIVESASATSVTPSLPGSLQNGDLVVFVCTVPCTSTATETTEPTQTISGWTKIAGQKFVNDTNAVSAWCRVKDGSWSTMPTVSTSHAAGRTAAISVAYRGVNQTTPIDASAVFSGTTTSGSGSNSLAMTGVTTATAGAMLLMFCILDSSSETFSPTAPSGMTFLATTTGTADGVAGRGMTLAEESRASAGATGSRTWNWTNSLGHGGYAFALKPGNQQTFTGTITSTGVIAKAITKNPFTGSTTATGVLTKLKVVTRVFTGSITATGALIRKTTKNAFTGSITSTGAFTKVPQKKLTGSITATGFFRKAFPRVFTGSITATGNLIVALAGRIFGQPGLAKVIVEKAAELRMRIRRG